MRDLDLLPAIDHPELLAAPVVAGLADLVPALAGQALVGAIDPDLADTAAFCERYDVAPEASANCVVVAGRRGGETRYAACLVLATTRADVNGVVRRLLDARKCSFAAMDDAVGRTGMAYGGITPVGLPTGWPVYLDGAVAASEQPLVIGSGVRGSKLWVPAGLLVALPGAQVIDELAG